VETAEAREVKDLRMQLADMKAEMAVLRLAAGPAK
jgi:hypothetical protein